VEFCGCLKIISTRNWSACRKTTIMRPFKRKSAFTANLLDDERPKISVLLRDVRLMGLRLFHAIRGVRVSDAYRSTLKVNWDARLIKQIAWKVHDTRRQTAASHVENWNQFYDGWELNRHGHHPLMHGRTFAWPFQQYFNLRQYSASSCRHDVSFSFSWSNQSVHC
jgi:hypothetical protein